jgi:hypothetical protein
MPSGLSLVLKTNFSFGNIQGDSEGKISIKGCDINGHC